MASSRNRVCGGNDDAEADPSREDDDEDDDDDDDDDEEEEEDLAANDAPPRDAIELEALSLSLSPPLELILLMPFEDKFIE